MGYVSLYCNTFAQLLSGGISTSLLACLLACSVGAYYLPKLTNKTRYVKADGYIVIVMIGG